jgi:hypothetical protein
LRQHRPGRRRRPKTVERKPPTVWEIARILLVLLLASMPILGISVDVLGIVPQSTTSIAVIAPLSRWRRAARR